MNAMARILIGIHHLELGGCQLNALDMAITMRNRGHYVVIFATYFDKPGPVSELIQRAGLPLVLCHTYNVWPGMFSVRPSVAAHLTRVARDYQVDLVHTYEHVLSLDAFYGPHLLLGLPLVYTIYSMSVPRWLPRYPEFVVGTQKLADEATFFRRRRPVLIEPPVNTDLDAPDTVDFGDFRATHGLTDETVVLTTVSRLEPSMKAEGIRRAIAAIRLLDDPRLRYVIVGDGPSFADIQYDAKKVNAELARTAVIMVGPMLDPRPAYAATDVALCMGGSALRAMAFAKPLIVLGISGFSKPFEPATAEEFFTEGFYGIGSGDIDPWPLAEQIRTLAASNSLRTDLGTFSRQVVLNRFSLKAATDRLENVYTNALAQWSSPANRWIEVAWMATYWTAVKVLPKQLKNQVRKIIWRY
jgi:glycosyltransferase involved in cell wall biosynthesis